MGEGLLVPEDFHDLPLRILGPSTRRLLSIHLDPPAVIPSSNGVLGDLSGLAELAGFEFCHIRYFETKHSRTYACLEEWSGRQSGTIGNLLSNLMKMERFDCLSDIKQSVFRDVRNHLDRISPITEMKRFNRESGDTTIVKHSLENIDNLSSTVTQEVMKDVYTTEQDLDSGFESIELNNNELERELSTIEESDSETNDEDINMREKGDNKIQNIKTTEKRQQRNMKPVLEPRPESPIGHDDYLTIDDREGKLKTYKACICCADDDLLLADKINSSFKDQDADFFIPQEALLGGRYEFETLAEVIETRCNSRVIVILSNQYLTSPACVFATQFVKTLDPDAKRRKIIPVLIDEEVAYPRVLRGISSIKARRLKFGSTFWNLLSASLHLDKINFDDNSDLLRIYDMNNLDKNNSRINTPNSKVTSQKSNTGDINPSSVQRKVESKSKDNIKSSVTGAYICSSIDLDKPSDSCDSGIMSGASGIQDVQLDARASPDVSNTNKKKNPGLKTLRRIMKSFNIMERKPKLGDTKRSHSTSEALSKPEPVHDRGSRSQSTNVPPVASNLIYEMETQEENTITQTESDATLEDFESNDKGNNLSTCDDSKPNNTVTRRKAGVSSTCSEHSDRLFSGQNILSPNIEPNTIDAKANQCNDLDSVPSRQVSRDDNTDVSCSSFDNTSLYSEIMSSENNSIISNSRKASMDNCSNASSFHQMPFLSSSRQPSFDYSSRQSSFECSSRQASFDQSSRQSSFENNSRPVSFDGTSLVSVEDNMAVDRQLNALSASDDARKSGLSNQQKSSVVFEIML